MASLKKQLSNLKERLATINAQFEESENTKKKALNDPRSAQKLVNAVLARAVQL